MTVLDDARKLAADCDEELHFERRVKRELQRLIAEIERLESELESIGAGGVGPLMPVASYSEIPNSSNHLKQHLNMVPKGWKLVPDEPTMSMQHAALISSRAHGPVSTGECNALPIRYELGASAMIYRAMLAAAPQPPTAEQSSAVEQPQGERHPGVLMPSRSLVDQVIRELTRYCNTGEMDDAESLLASLQFSIDPAQQPPQDEPAPLELKA